MEPKVILALANKLHCTGIQDEKTLQDKIMLCQYLGLGLGYKFTWEDAEVHCNELSDDFRKALADGETSFTLSNKALGIAKAVNSIEQVLGHHWETTTKAYSIMAAIALLHEEKHTFDVMLDRISTGHNVSTDTVGEYYGRLTIMQRTLA